MSYDDDERSITQNRPIDLFTITTPTVTYRLTSHNVNVTYGGSTFTAITMSRGAQEVTQDPTGRELILYLPITHPLVQRFAATGIPEHQIQVVQQRLQSVSGIAVQQLSGFATGLAIQGHVASIRIPSVADDAMKIKLPVIHAQKLCNHTLYDSGCAPNPGIDGPSRTSFAVGTNVSSQVIAPGLVTLNVDTMGGQPDEWATFGELLHTLSGQRVMILRHVGTALTLNVPLVGVQPGDGVSVFAGCAHSSITCRDKFSNVVNFGGMPEINGSFSPWRPGVGLSSIQQP